MTDELRTDRPRTTDPLTGLLHREAWELQVPALLEEADASRVPVCLLVLDLDDFTMINAERGRDEGDRLLKEVAGLWRNHVRQHDLLARVGPDEFAVLLPSCSLEAASAVARRLCGFLDQTRVSASAGGAEWNQLETAMELLARADMAMQRARRLPTDRVEIAAEVSSTRS